MKQFFDDHLSPGLLENLNNCVVFCESGPDNFLAFFFLGAAILGLEVVLHK